MSLPRSSSVRSGHSRLQTGFTLVEMLVVLGIIGILVAILLPAVMAAMNAARRATIALEIKNLEAALDTYKQSKGEYPPSFGERDMGGSSVYGLTSGPKNRYNSIVERHLQRAYPKFIDNPSSTSDNKDYFYTGGGGFTGASNVDQGEALVLWLSLLSTNAANPIDTTSTRNGFYEFDARRLVDTDGDGLPTYQPRHCRDTDYLYMESRTYTTYIQNNNYARSATNPTTHQVIPYGSNATTPVNPSKFQIICAGLDGDFGTPLPAASGGMYPVKQFPAGIGYVAGDRDNLTNFSGGSTLGDLRPQ